MSIQELLPGPAWQCAFFRTLFSRSVTGSALTLNPSVDFKLFLWGVEDRVANSFPACRLLHSPNRAAGGESCKLWWGPIYYFLLLWSIFSYLVLNLFFGLEAFPFSYHVKVLEVGQELCWERACLVRPKPWVPFPAWLVQFCFYYTNSDILVLRVKQELLIRLEHCAISMCRGR